MVSEAGTSLRDALGQKMDELSEALNGLDEAKAGQRAADAEWCCKEILSHLMGDEGEDILAPFRQIIEEDTPLIGIVTGLPYYTPDRQTMSLAEMRGAVSSRYRELAEFLGGLTEADLARKARVPLFKETPIGEYATMAQFAGALNFHLTDHINQISNARQQVGA
ncbi:MAG: DinB family protein [Chloroflexi bacterium]|nr:DinB family protein [Chloroflexota bacterium]